MPANNQMELTFDEWKVEGRELFGEDFLEWEFVCPSCRGVQKPSDFKKYKDKGATPDTAMLNCIGRYDGHMQVDMGSGKSPCNYCSGGLFNINPVAVSRPGEKLARVFEFNKEDL